MTWSDHETSMAFTVRFFLLRVAVAAAIVLTGALLSRAGGPKCVAGTTYFDSTLAGQPLTWPQGQIIYYTDQGDLSSQLPNAAANSFVADAFSHWTSVSTAALSATAAGSLAEDVNSSNVFLNSDGSISVPLDIQSSATTTPIGIVYDADGSVIDALLGTGAGDSSQCFSNAVIGGQDNYGSLATYQHALIVINGLCAQQSSQLTDVEYRLIRAIGGVLGLGWSQLNVNVQTGSPTPTSDDFAGFPLMHFVDSSACVPITRCYANPLQLSADDVAAISRLYPVTAQNRSSFPGKQTFSSSTARIHGSVWFTDSHGNRTQPMQGVNIVARWIDQSGKPSRRYAASSVSGFLFTGNAGNPVTGFTDSTGDPFAEWGSADSALEGYFDLPGLPLPNGTNSAQYQLSVEPLDTRWSSGVGPYAPSPVSPSGSFTPITVTVSAGSDLTQDILMSGTAQPVQPTSSSWTAPAKLPPGGDWVSSLSSYGDIDYILLPAQANRTLSIAVTALDDAEKPSQVKAQPVIGMWNSADPEGTTPPAFTPSPFNQLIVGMTRLDTQVLTTGSFLIGISDVRGDGRPDFRYHARVLYGDTVSPARVGVGGGPIAILGSGFAPWLSTTVGVSPANQLAVAAGTIVIAAPAHSDGQQDITITDPATGASSSMTGVLTYGAAADDTLVFLRGANPPTPVGGQATYPLMVQALTADGATPVAGATVGWSATNAVQLSACNGSSSCSVTTDQNGIVSTWLTPAAIGTANITATLAPGVYASPKSVTAILATTESASDLGASNPYLYIAQGATTSVPLTVRALSNGVAKSNTQINFSFASGSGTLSAPSAQTNSSGFATVTLTVTQFTATAQVTACVSSGAPCVNFYVTPVAAANLQLQQVSGAGQISTGSAFQPVVVRVIDMSSPPNPVIAATVTFQTTVLRRGGTIQLPGNGETNPGDPEMPVILQVSQASVTSDANGQASFTPSAAGFSPPVEVDVMIQAGTGPVLDDPLELYPPVSQ